jgi:hypothetical protein
LGTLDSLLALQRETNHEELVSKEHNRFQALAGLWKAWNTNPRKMSFFQGLVMEHRTQRNLMWLKRISFESGPCHRLVPQSLSHGYLNSSRA